MTFITFDARLPPTATLCMPGFPPSPRVRCRKACFTLPYLPPVRCVSAPVPRTPLRGLRVCVWPRRRPRSPVTFFWTRHASVTFGPFSYEPLRNRPTNRPIHGASLPGSRLTCAVARPCGNSPSPLHRAVWPRYGQAVGCQELHPYRPASRACLITLLKRSVASNSSSARRSSYKGSTNSAMPAAPGHTEHYG